MLEIQQTIESYKNSINLVDGRIQELHKAIEKNGGEGHPKTRPFARRRYLLYQQMAEMQQSLRLLEEYSHSVIQRQPTIEHVAREGNLLS